MGDFVAACFDVLELGYDIQLKVLQIVLPLLVNYRKIPGEFVAKVCGSSTSLMIYSWIVA